MEFFKEKGFRLYKFSGKANSSYLITLLDEETTRDPTVKAYEYKRVEGLNVYKQIQSLELYDANENISKDVFPRLYDNKMFLVYSPSKDEDILLKLKDAKGDVSLNIRELKSIKFDEGYKAGDILDIPNGSWSATQFKGKAGVQYVVSVKAESYVDVNNSLKGYIGSDKALGEVKRYEAKGYYHEGLKQMDYLFRINYLKSCGVWSCKEDGNYRMLLNSENDYSGAKARVWIYEVPQK